MRPGERRKYYRFFPRAIFLNYHLYETEGIAVPGDQGGYLLTQEEWEEIKTDVDKFYATVPAEEIAEHNRQVDIDHHIDRRPERGRHEP